MSREEIELHKLKKVEGVEWSGHSIYCLPNKRRVIPPEYYLCVSDIEVGIFPWHEQVQVCLGRAPYGVSPGDTAFVDWVSRTVLALLEQYRREAVDLVEKLDDARSRFGDSQQTGRLLQEEVEELRMELMIRERIQDGWRASKRCVNLPSHRYVYYTYHYRTVWEKDGVKEEVESTSWRDDRPHPEPTRFERVYRKVTGKSI